MQGVCEHKHKNSDQMASSTVTQNGMSPGRALSPTRRASQPVTTNKNVEWLSAPGAWTFIVALIGLGWLILSLFMDSGLAWTYVHLLHGVITYYLLHWNKGSPVQMDQVWKRLFLHKICMLMLPLVFWGSDSACLAWSCKLRYWADTLMDKLKVSFPSALHRSSSLTNSAEHSTHNVCFWSSVMSSG